MSSGAFDGELAPEVLRLRAEMQAERTQDILESLTICTTVEAIEAEHPYLTKPELVPGQFGERQPVDLGWRAFRIAAAGGGEVWEFRCAGSFSGIEGFAVVRDNRVVAEIVMCVTSWI